MVASPTPVGAMSHRYVEWSIAVPVLMFPACIAAAYVAMAYIVTGHRYVEWSIAVPVLMFLVGRSVPTKANSDPSNLRPAIVVTMVRAIPTSAMTTSAITMQAIAIL